MMWLKGLLGIIFISTAIIQSTFADSYIYVTNTTPQTVSLKVNQTGDILEQGNQWGQEATHIAPYETKRVLRINRYKGLGSGKTYSFNTTVSSGNSQIAFVQTMTGTWYGSTIKHGIQTNSIISPWYSDRNIHRVETIYDGLSAQAAVKAEFTGGYDDFYYTIHQNTVAESVSNHADELKVLTYNIYALPLVASKISARLTELPHHIDGYDVIMMQEAFSSERTALLNKLAQQYPYQTYVPGTGLNLYNSGVLIISRYPIVKTDDMIYPDCTGTDCFADKGIIYAEIIKNGKAYHLAATHTASFDTAEARALRQVQFKQIRQFIDQKNIPNFDAVLMGGDLNVNKLKWPQDYQDMLMNLNATAPITTGYTTSTFDPRVNKLASAAVSGGTTVEYLDYVLNSNTHRQPKQARNDVRILRSTVDPLYMTWDLSDHLPVMGHFDYGL